MLPAMAKKPSVAIVGPGRFGSALALGLKEAGYNIPEIVSRNRATSKRKARALARRVGATAATKDTAKLAADVVWFCVPDREIESAARELAARTLWKGKSAFHSSGALESDHLSVLRRAGASVGSVHPFMTFVSRSVPSLQGVPFGVEGDTAAVRVARGVIRSLRGHAFSIVKSKKAAYHAWGGFLSPLLVSLLVTAEQVAAAAGFPEAEARRWALPILQQTIANYGRLGPVEALSGPLVRGEVAVVKRHLQVLRKIPAARDVYVALAKSALRNLPTKNRKQLHQALHD
jgi:predicted short-subunit dehydrogenase-like oxidoreductase (DUF2520 family)